MIDGGTALDVERVYDAIDWAVSVLSDAEAGSPEQQDLLMELIAVRTDLMEALGMLEES